jgi:hypothetical protein
MKLARELTSEKVSPPHRPSPRHIQGQVDLSPKRQFSRRSTRLSGSWISPLRELRDGL